MYSIWTRNLSDQEEKTKFENSVRSAREVLDRQKTLLQEELKDLDRSEVDLKSYDSPSWSAKQAHKNGDRSRIMWMLKLIDLDQQDNKNDRRLTS